MLSIHWFYLSVGFSVGYVVSLALTLIVLRYKDHIFVSNEFKQRIKDHKSLNKQLEDEVRELREETTKIKEKFAYIRE